MPAAAGQGGLRTSHADREHVIDTLKAAFVQGRLTKDEFDARISQAFASRTYGQLDAVTIDLPAGLAGTQPPRKLACAQARPPVNKVVLWASFGIILLAVGGLVAGSLAGSFGLFLLAFFVIFGAVIAPVIAMFDSWEHKRTRGHLPPQPPQRGQALEDAKRHERR